MDQRESPLIDDLTKDTQTKSSSISDIDQLCHLIDQSTFGGCLNGSPTKSSNLSVRFRSVPSSQVKAFRSTRLKRLHSSSTSKLDEDNGDDEEEKKTPAIPSEKSSCRSLIPSTRRTFSMRLSLSSPTSFLNRFRSLSTSPFPLSRRHSHLPANLRASNSRYPSPSTLTLVRTKSVLPDIIEEETNQEQTPSPPSPQLSCTIVDTRRPTGNSCNVEELAAYLDNFLYLPKSLSGAAELMYT